MNINNTRGNENDLTEIDGEMYLDSINLHAFAIVLQPQECESG